MSMQILKRCGAVLLAGLLVAGCSGPDPMLARNDNCGWNRSSCQYEGAYETGEREFAEQEARRLNQAQSLRMRRSFWW